jgi:hypothetical protein
MSSIADKGFLNRVSSVCRTPPQTVEDMGVIALERIDDPKNFFPDTIEKYQTATDSGGTCHAQSDLELDLVGIIDCLHRM